MAKFIGRKIQVGIGKEAVRGTALAPTYWLDLSNITVEDEFDTVTDDNSIGTIEDAKDVKVSKKFAKGELAGKVADKSFGLILLSSLGAVSSAVKETTAYTHTFTVGQTAQHQSLTVEAKNPNEQLAFANAVVGGIEIKAEHGKYVDFKADLVSKAGVTAVSTPTYTEENNFIAKDVSVKFAANLAGLGAASAISVKSTTIKVDSNVESDDVLGSVEPTDFLNKNFGITGTIELAYDATTYKALALAGTKQALRITIADTTKTIGATSNPTIQIDLAKVALTEWKRSSGANEVIKQTLNFKALYSIADTKMVTIAVTNTAVSY